MKSGMRTWRGCAVGDDQEPRQEKGRRDRGQYLYIARMVFMNASERQQVGEGPRLRSWRDWLPLILEQVDFRTLHTAVNDHETASGARGG